MANEELIENEDSNTGLQIDFGKLLFKLLKNIHWILLCVICAFAIGKIYLRYQIPVYNVSANILLNAGESANTIKIGVQEEEDPSFQNEIFILKSYSLIKEIIDSLDLKIHLVHDARIKQQPIDVQTLPFRIKFLQANPKANTIVYKLSIGRNGYMIKSDAGENLYIYDKPYVLGKDTIIVYKLGDLERYIGDSYHFNIISDDEAVNKYLNRLSVSLLKTGKGILQLSLNDEIPTRAERFLNVLIREYNRTSRDYKNKSVRNALNFLEERLEIVGSELRQSENKEKDYLSANKIYDISSEATSVMAKMSQIDAEASSAEYKNMLLNVLEKHVSNTEQKELFPSTIGITDPTLSNQVDIYNNLLLKKRMILDLGTPNDPNLPAYNGQLKEVRTNILKSIQNIRTQLNVNKEYLSNLNDEYSGKLRSLPGKEKELLRIKRDLSIKENLYTFLLQKKEETSVQLMSSNDEGSRIIDAPKASGVISPDSKKTYSLFLSVGLLLPISVILLRTIMNKRIESKKDIELITSIPIIAEISQMDVNESRPILTFADSKKLITEQFRILRSNLTYMGLEKEKKVIFISSAISGEGKSFVALNLANILAQAGKKVALLEFDLRKPKISERLGIINSRGLSEFIALDLKPEEIIKKLDDYPNLYLLSSGAIPPNPAELMLSTKVVELITFLRANFDFIIIDTAPVGIVSDALGIAKLADISLYIIRHNFTLKPTISYLNQIVKEKKLPNPSIVIYGAEMKGSGYGYNYGYGYGYYGNSNGYYENDGTKTGSSLAKIIKRKKNTLNS